MKEERKNRRKEGMEGGRAEERRERWQITHVFLKDDSAKKKRETWREATVFCALRFRFPGDRSEKKSESEMCVWYSSVHG